MSIVFDCRTFSFFKLVDGLRIIIFVWNAKRFFGPRQINTNVNLIGWPKRKTNCTKSKPLDSLTGVDKGDKIEGVLGFKLIYFNF